MILRKTRWGHISVQVLNEFVAVPRRKLAMSWHDINDALSAVRVPFGNSKRDKQVDPCPAFVLAPAIRLSLEPYIEWICNGFGDPKLCRLTMSGVEEAVHCFGNDCTGNAKQYTFVLHQPGGSQVARRLKP
jgi:hypothetical protein